MKIAAITDDGKTISQHFGRAAYYLVITAEDHNIIDCEMRGKPGHSQFLGEGQEHHEDLTVQHGYGLVAEDRHTRMAEVVTDCQVLLCRGMGRGAYDSMQARGIHPVVTDIADIEQAVFAYLDGKLVDHVDRLH